jgi:enoyl-CoA hydratase
MKYQTLLIARTGNVATVTFNRPELKNALGLQSLVELKQLMEELRVDLDTRFVIFTGAGDGFCSGAEVSDRLFKESANMGAEMTDPRLQQLFGQDLMHAMESLEQVTIAAVNGVAMGAGLYLAMNCDFRIASENALFGVPEAKLGIFFTWGATPRLVSLIGPSKAKELIMTCDNIDAQEAWRIGLVNKVVPTKDLMSTCQEMVEKIGSKGKLAIRMTKKLVNAASVAKMADLYPLEPELAERLAVSGEIEECITALIEKRPPRFS